ncbi:hypothetical protein GNI_031600 [Gregarina niphandrodes]|uniref:Uncharacterized protein n=1 Tax=Gregarina niphandrodes TaxID=110365 RepID=A0A023BB68_GRENI|nr:hypothetical protein GNI_031600 [Gregarina niphandrodes]EZG78868.1 hypothetical protein GNI_031600 [Gregarina niphandrodes]|eukprot:XP_011129176.1 hypothetical protein GNI_031600 [Gregarina niphandrodes]
MPEAVDNTDQGPTQTSRSSVQDSRSRPQELRPSITQETGGDEVKILSQLLKEERDKKETLKQTYERHLCQLRADYVTKIAQARAQVLTEVDDTLKRYHRLAQEAIRAGKRATFESECKEREYRTVAEEACTKFEQDCKDKLKEVLDGYRYLADRAAQQADQETRVLKEKYQEMVETQIIDKRNFEQRLVEATEEQVAPYKAEIMRLETENRMLRMTAEHTFGDIKEEVARNFERFESMLISTCLSLLWQHNIPITELELRDRLTDALDARPEDVASSNGDE